MKKKPFFARFLENQELEQAQGGAGHSHTGKHKDVVTTKKYPSDSDEAVMVTMKFPSDSDESSTSA